MVLVSYAPLAVSVSGSLHSLIWRSTGVRMLHTHRPVMLLFHPVKIVFPSNFTLMAYLSRVTIQPASHKFTRVVWRIYYPRNGVHKLSQGECNMYLWVGHQWLARWWILSRLVVYFWLGWCLWYKTQTLPIKVNWFHLNWWCLGWSFKGGSTRSAQ